MARAAEQSYNTRLRQVARQVGHIVSGIAPDGQPNVQQERDILATLRQYARILAPWARTVARHMIVDVDRRNERTWREAARQMSKALREEIRSAPTGMLYDALMDEQVELITSLPTKAADRVHHLVTESLMTSRRASEVAKDILATGHVTGSRATLIARTEVSRAQSNLTQVRAMYAGSEGYIWRSSRDGDVRPTHKAVDGTYQRWASPPKTDANLDPYHAGCGPNCRCWAEPIFPEFT